MNEKWKESLKQIFIKLVIIMGNYLWMIILIIKFINKIYKVDIYEIDYNTKTIVIFRYI